MSNIPFNKTLVIGAGIAGINAALRLIESGMEVYLCESKPYIGGTLFRLDRWFPDDHCGMCRTLPVFDDSNSSGYCLRKGLFNRDIKILLNTTVTTVTGEKGNFSVTLLRKSDHDEILALEVGSIILSTGFEEFDPAAASAFGYGRYPNVITNIEIECQLSSGSESHGIPLRPSDQKVPETVAFLQCIGSRSRERDYCSAVCCMYALKEAIMLKQVRPATDVTIFFMDMRAYGKSYYRYYQEAQEKYGIRFQRCRVPVVRQDFRNKDLLVTSTGDDNRIRNDRFSLVVLSVGQNPSSNFPALCRSLGIETDKFGFCTTETSAPLETNRPGIYVCGSACGPEDIADTIMESTAAAGLAGNFTVNDTDLTTDTTLPMTRRVLVIGGGLAGLVAANQIAANDIDVELIEKTDRLGGNALTVYYSEDGKNIRGYLDNLIESTKLNSGIHIRMQTELVNLEGYAGKFNFTLRDLNGKFEDVESGVLIVASGAGELVPAEYLFGKAENIITQRKLEQKIFTGDISSETIRSVAMIQCVGSRDSERPYCSRVCCVQALKNALLLKQHNPEIAISIFYRDMMSYGLKEEYYTGARESGILFFRYDLEHKPAVSLRDKALNIDAMDISTGEPVSISPDLLVLSPAIIPSNAELAKIIGTDLTPDGFFKEADIKFRPVDLLKDGIFICGLAHSPRDVTETIVQAQAAAQRALCLLSGKKPVPGALVSTVNKRRCTGCEKCVKACPYSARVKDPEKGIVKVLEPFCRGCGTCVAECPNGAAGLTERNINQIFSMIDAAI